MAIKRTTKWTKKRHVALRQIVERQSCKGILTECRWWLTQDLLRYSPAKNAFGLWGIDTCKAILKCWDWEHPKEALESMRLMDKRFGEGDPTFERLVREMRG